MCGRYALGLRASLIRYQIQQQGLPVDEAPVDDDVRQTYNFAPGSYGLVYRADVPDHGARGDEGESQQDETHIVSGDCGTGQQPPQSSTSGRKEYRHQLQAMRWGLIPFWTKRSPDYGSMLRTINCRDDSLIESRGMWNTMKQRKRCVVICQGFYEWLKKGPGGKEKIPHFVKRKDGNLMCFAGLWDVVKYEDAEEKLYTYTIITTASNKQLQFLHDRMPVILDAGSEKLKIWLDPERAKWSSELQSILQPYEGELDCYPVSKDVGKVGNNSPDFIVPLDSKENKKNIANFFGNAQKGLEKSKGGSNGETVKEITDVKVEKEEDERRVTKDHGRSEDNAPVPFPPEPKIPETGRKREHSPDTKTSIKAPKTPDAPIEGPASVASGRKTRSAIRNGTGPKGERPKKDGSQRITSFFGK